MNWEPKICSITIKKIAQDDEAIKLDIHCELMAKILKPSMPNFLGKIISIKNFCIWSEAEGCENSETF